MIDSLSLKTAGLVSRLSVIGLAPPLAALVDLLTRTALLRFSVLLNDSDIWCAVPSGAMLTQGSERARRADCRRTG